MADDLDKMLADFNDTHTDEKPDIPEDNGAGEDIFGEPAGDGSDPLAELDFQDAPQNKRWGKKCPPTAP